jgi:hypothetical protein
VLITIEPCRGGRYRNGHNCYEFFDKGRVVDGKLCKFIAAEPYTPVFYLQDQPAPEEEKSTVSGELARVNKSVMMESLANLGGPPYGQVSMPSTNKEIWDVSGQGMMKAQEIVYILLKANSRRTWLVEKWNTKTYKVEADVQAEVRTLLSVHNAQVLHSRSGHSRP